MNPEHLLALAAIQGITEFLPVSSSAHLVLLPALTGGPDQGLLVDVAAHGGTLCAVVLYFRRKLWRMGRAVAGLDAEAVRIGERRLFWMLALASLPVVAAGAAMWRFGWAEEFRSPASIAWLTIAFGALLYAGDRWGGEGRTQRDIGPRLALVVGCAQALALFPGVSRAGVTITAARFLGVRREDSASFSLLMAIPAVGAALVLGAHQILQGGDSVLTAAAATVFLLSLLTALASIWAMMWIARNFRLTVFVVYRVALGATILAVHAG